MSTSLILSLRRRIAEAKTEEADMAKHLRKSPRQAERERGSLVISVRYDQLEEILDELEKARAAVEQLAGVA